MNYLEKEIALFKRRKQLLNQPILKVVGEGCQAISEFQWIGKVIGFEEDKEKGWTVAVIKILKHNRSYGDARDAKEDEIYTYPIANKYYMINDIQNVDGVWILYT